MIVARQDVPPLEQLERALIDEFIRDRGHDPSHLDMLPAAERHVLLAAASVHASLRLMEVESRARFVHDIHDGGAHN
jgi:hypothetical protein